MTFSTGTNGLFLSGHVQNRERFYFLQMSQLFNLLPVNFMTSLRSRSIICEYLRTANLWQEAVPSTNHLNLFHKEDVMTHAETGQLIAGSIAIFFGLLVIIWPRILAYIVGAYFIIAGIIWIVSALR